MAVKQHKMRHRALLSLALSSSPLLVCAASTTVQMIQPIGSDIPGIVASVMNVDATATTYAMACGPKFPDQVSGFSKAVICATIAQLTVTQGPATIAFTTPTNIGEPKAAPTTLKVALACHLGPLDAICTNSYEGIEAAAKMTDGISSGAMAQYKAKLDQWKTPETTTISGGIPMGPVVITAGVEKLAAPSSGSASSSSVAAMTTISSKTSASSSVKASSTSKAGAAPTGSAHLVSGLALIAGFVGVFAL